MTIKIEQAEGRVPQEELDFFLKGNGFVGFHSPPIHGHTGHACPFAISSTSSKIPLQLSFQGLHVVVHPLPQKHFLVDLGHLCQWLC